jgi:ATP-dependent Lon protease
MDPLDQKLLDCFPGKVVRKDLVAPLRNEYHVPSYVVEFLFGRYCSSQDEEVILAGLAEVQRTLTEHFVRSEKAPEIQAILRDRGKYTIIDKVKARLDPKRNVYWADLVQLRVADATIPEEYPQKKYRRLLTAGIWCQVEIAYLPENVIGGAMYPFAIQKLKPIQVATGGLEEVRQARPRFTTSEWIDVLLRSMGFRSDAFTERQKLLILLRLVPFVEDNYNLVEFGPRGTGKSYCYRELSPNAILISGGETTVPNLFGRNTPKKTEPGLVSQWDVIAFDEVAGLDRISDPQALQIFKDYMESGAYSRGKEPITAHASMVFEGNLDLEVQIALRTSHLFCPFPTRVGNDRAFLDRFHSYLPGWEMPRMQTWMFGDSYGFIVDYLAGVLQELRAQSHATAIDHSFVLGPAVDKRDDKAIRRTVSGLIKLVHPDGRYTAEDVEPLLLLAMEGRRRVKEQLKRLGGLEFWNTSFTYGPRENGQPHQEVTLPERVEERFLSNAKLPPGRLYCVGRDRRNRRTCLFRVEVERIKGTGRCQLASPNRGDVADGLRIAYDQIKKHVTDLGIKENLAQWDLRVQVANPMEADEPSLLGIPIYVAIISALLGQPIETGTVVAGEMSVQGNLEGIDSVGEVIMIALEYGALQIALPAMCQLDVSNVPAQLTKGIGIVYYDRPRDLVDRVLSQGENGPVGRLAGDTSDML